MSAIAGILNLTQEAVPFEHGRHMMESLQRYPADAVQMWRDEHVFLGCHAQWITTESVGKRLPYYDYIRGLTITADAMIDNRRELFEKLQIHKHQQEYISDSELILLSYDKWQEEAPKHLIGDFAFIIWDEKRQQLFGARDFSGSRTLYYYQDARHFAFCTVIHPLFTLPYISKQLNEQWLAEYLAIAGMVDAVTASFTPYKQIQQIPPSHSLTIKDGKVSLSRYCVLAAQSKLHFKSDDEYVEAFQEVFQRAVDDRLRTYRGIGAQLSGGLDSGSIVGFAVPTLRKENKILHTFSYIPPKDFQDFTAKSIMSDETPLIQETVRHVGGVEQHYLPFEGRDPFSEVDDLLEAMEMPYKFFENSFWLKGMFEEAHERGIGVLLNGGRGNLSISWGPALDYYAILFKKMKWMHLYKELNQYSRNTGGARLRLLPEIARIAFPALQSSAPFAGSSLISEEFAHSTNVFARLRQHGMDKTGWLATADAYEQRENHFRELFHWNASNTIAAKLSLRYAVWKRDPTNDLRVIQFCLSVPEEQYVQNGLDRALIRRAAEKRLPDTVRLNQRVHGAQGLDWVHRMTKYWEGLIEELEAIYADSDTSRFLNKQAIKKALELMKQGANPEYALSLDYKAAMRSVIVYRFLKQFT